MAGDALSQSAAFPRGRALPSPAYSRNLPSFTFTAGLAADGYRAQS